MAQGIENLNPPQNVFRSVVENAVQLSGSEGGFEGLVDELCSDEGLANVSVRNHVWCFFFFVGGGGGVVSGSTMNCTSIAIMHSRC